MATDLLDATVKEDTPNDEGDHFGKNRNRSRLDTVETRRYAAYFASTTSLGKMWAAADKENRWDLVSATVEPGEDQRAYPARDIDIASHSKMQFTAHKPNPSPNAPDATSSQGISTLDTVPAAPFNRELKPRFSRSRRDGLNEARKEALAILTECEKGTIVCPRPDCHDTVRDLKALIYHLHIHNIHDRSFACSDCGGLYECKRELAMHVCRRGPKPPSNPIKRVIHCLVSKLACTRDDDVDDV